MKRFWREVTVVPAEGGFRVLLDSRPIRTPLGAPQIVASRALAEALADEWRQQQGDEIDLSAFVLRDMADQAIDLVAPGRAGTIARLLAYAETDTLCYRGEPDEPIARRQRQVWEPLLKTTEDRHQVRFERIGGIVHRPQPAATLDSLRSWLERKDDFTLAALLPLTSLAASLCVGLAAVEPGADVGALWDAANLEEDWQREQWGEDAEAMDRRARRLRAFEAAARFAVLVRG